MTPAASPSSPPLIEFEVRYRFRDLVETNAAMPRCRAARWLLIGGAVVAICTVSALPLIYTPEMPWGETVLVVSAAWSFIALIGWFYPWLASLLPWLADPCRNATGLVRADEDGLMVEFGPWHATWPWAALTRTRNTRDVIVLEYRSPLSPLIIPKRDIQAAGWDEALLELVSRKLAAQSRSGSMLQ